MPAPAVVEGPEGIARAVSTLGQGSVAAFPTETVYGLGADALNQDAVAKVFDLKGRPSTNPLIVHVSGTEMARTVVAEWTDAAQRLADTFWPGPLTIVLNKSSVVPGAVTAEGPTVAVRCPDHPIALALIEAFGKPIVGPSANPSGRVSPTTCDHVEHAFADTDLVILDGGPCRAGIESTVVDLTTGQPRVLRPGVIGAAAISATLASEVSQHHGTEDPPSRIASPGLLGAHYEPETRCLLVPSGFWDQACSMSMRTPSAVLWYHEGKRDLIWGDAPRLQIRLPADAAGYARELYAALREADKPELGLILVEEPPTADDSDYLDPDGPSRAIWQAIHDRLRRACERWEPKSPFSGNPLPHPPPPGTSTGQ